MLEVAVIADDLTGAADAGIQFQPAFAPIYMVNHRFWSLDDLAPPPRVVSLFTASRGLSPSEAHREVFKVCRTIGVLAPGRIYKKIDSALRGNLGAELEAVMSAFNLAMSLIAPAFIEQGRTTVDGIHCIHGRPVADTDMGCDPVSPVHGSRLPDRVGLQACHPVAHIDLATLERGADATAQAIDCAFGRGSRHFTFDASGREHLDRIAHVALSRYPQALLCGSAGLAGSMARALAAGQAPPPDDGSRICAALSGHWLFACGSASERLHRQVRLFAERSSAMVETLEPDWLAADPPAESLTAAIHRASARLAVGDTVVSLPPPSDLHSVEPGRLAASFARAIAAVIGASRPAGLFLSGGDTALAVLERLGARAVRLEHEVGCGLVLGSLIGGASEGLPVVTKAGAFGPPEALLTFREAISGARGSVWS
jgi:uncharacterized protein YgbK (DUF1537 family)